MSEQFCLDANVFITAWKVRYPPHIFKPLWDQICAKSERIEIIKPIYDEIDRIRQVDKKLPRPELQEKYPLRFWLEGHGFQIIDIDGDVENISIRLERKYQISEESAGADQNDIRLVAYSQIRSKTVVTLEKNQKNRPQKISKYKIPIICDDEGVECVEFIEFIDRLGIRIR
jgi:hypothetical protein